MKNLIILMGAMGALLLSATSCKSTTSVFKEVQSTTTVEESYDMVSTPLESKKPSYVYNSSAKTTKLPTDFGVTKTIADLNVSPTKIEYNCTYSGPDNAAGRKAAINYAITQALSIHGNADVLLEPKYEIQTDDGRIKSVKVSGYVATYCNFRTATKEDIKMLKEGSVQVEAKTSQQD